MQDTNIEYELGIVSLLICCAETMNFSFTFNVTSVLTMVAKGGGLCD